MLVRGGAGRKRAFLRTALRVLPRRVPLRVVSLPPRDGSEGITRHCIVLHGWGLDAIGLKDMRDALRKLPECGSRRFWSISYDTQWTHFEENARAICRELRQCPFAFDDVVLIGYSMGGIVARSMVAQGFPCSALLALAAPHDGPLPWIVHPGPSSLSGRSPSLRALNNNSNDRIHRNRYHFFAVTYTDMLGFHDHDGLIARASALGEKLGPVASRHTMHLRYPLVAFYDPHWRAKMPAFMPQVLRAVAQIEMGQPVASDMNDQGQSNSRFSAKDPDAAFQDRPSGNDGARIRPNAKPGDILLFMRARGPNRLITWFTHSPYYHAALLEQDSIVVEARPRGVIRRDLNGPDGDRYFIVVPAPNGKGEAALAWAQTQIGDGYDPVDVLVIILERVFKTLKLNYQAKGRYTCAEFVATAFLQAGADLFPGRNPDAIAPADIYSLLQTNRRDAEAQSGDELYESESCTLKDL